MRMKCACRLKCIENSTAQEISSGDLFHVVSCYFSFLFHNDRWFCQLKMRFCTIQESNHLNQTFRSLFEKSRKRKKERKPLPMARFRFYFVVFLSYKTAKPLPLTWIDGTSFDAWNIWWWNLIFSVPFILLFQPKPNIQTTFHF